jgi:ATP-dependent Zn protease
MTFGYSPVMIEHLFDEALVWALRRGAPALDWADVQQAKMTEELGLTERVEYTDEERRTIATHEAGHATVAWLVGTDRKLDVLSIVKRRDALGLLAHSDLEERFTKRKGELFGLVQIAFGGMVAEELYFGEAGTGPSGDLVGATSIAAQMVGSFGMAGSLISYEASALAGHDNLVAKVLASEAGRDAVESLLADAKASVTEMLSSHSHILEGLRDALLERDELIGDEITDVIGAVARGAVRPGPMSVAASRVVDLRDGADDVQQEGQHESLLPPRVVPS